MFVTSFVLLRRNNEGAVYVMGLSMSADAKCTEVLSERQPRIFLLEKIVAHFKFDDIFFRRPC